MKSKNRVIVVLDVDSVEEAIALVKKLSSHVGGFKIGFELVCAMLASLLSPPYKEDKLNNQNKIVQLFDLLGFNTAKALLFASKAEGAGCDGIIFIPQGLVLVNKELRVLGAIRSTGEPIEISTIGHKMLLGRQITQASDPIEAVMQAAIEAERAWRNENVRGFGIHGN